MIIKNGDHEGRVTFKNYIRNIIFASIQSSLDILSEEDKKELGALIDINNLVKLNSDLGKKLKNIPYNRYYEETVKGAIRKRIKILNAEKIKRKQEEYKEESRKNGLIYSGIYNSTSGVNNLNQFIQAENITKDLNPTYGGIQKLFQRGKFQKTKKKQYAKCVAKCLFVHQNS